GGVEGVFGPSLRKANLHQGLTGGGRGQAPPLRHHESPRRPSCRRGGPCARPPPVTLVVTPRAVGAGLAPAHLPSSRYISGLKVANTAPSRSPITENRPVFGQYSRGKTASAARGPP